MYFQGRKLIEIPLGQKSLCFGANLPLKWPRLLGTCKVRSGWEYLPMRPKRISRKKAVERAARRRAARRRATRRRAAVWDVV
jgi:hypothetical protein